MAETTTTTTPLDLDAIEARASKATPGPYEPESEMCDCGGDHPCDHGLWTYALRLPEPHTERDGEPQDFDFIYSEIGELTPETLFFFASARQDVPALVAEARLLRRKLALLFLAAEAVESEADGENRSSRGLADMRRVMNTIPAGFLGEVSDAEVLESDEAVTL